MSDPIAEMAERHGRMLAELAELNLSTVRILHGRLERAEGDDQARDLAMALQRASRSLRQTLFLETRLQKDRLIAAREAATDVGTAAEAQAKARKARVRHAVARAAFKEFDDAQDAEELLEQLDARLDGYVASHDFEDGRVEELVALICRDLGLEPPDDAEGSDDEPDASKPKAGPTPAPAEAEPEVPPRLVMAPHGGWTTDTS